MAVTENFSKVFLIELHIVFPEMVYSLISSLFEEEILINLTNAEDVVITNCQISNFDSINYPLYILTTGFCTLEKSSFFNLLSNQPGYYIKSEEAKVSDLFLYNIGQVLDDSEGSGCQYFLCNQINYHSSNISNVDVKHVCIVEIAQAKIALFSFLNAINDSANINGVGIQFLGITEVSSLQFSNFIDISSPSYGIIRAVNSAATLYAISCYFSGIKSGEFAFFGESSIKVLKSPSYISSIVTRNVEVSNSLEISSFNIIVNSRIIHRSSANVNFFFSPVIFGLIINMREF